MDPLIFSLSPSIYIETEHFDSGTALPASSRPAEPPCGIPRASIERIGLTFEFSRSEAQNLVNGEPTEPQLLETLSSPNEYLQNPFGMPDWTLSSTELYDINNCPELYRDLEKTREGELSSLFKDDTHNLPSSGGHLLDIIPHRSTDEKQKMGLKAEIMSPGPSLRDIDPRHILGLAHAGLRSIFYNVGTERASGVRAFNESTRFKLPEISPALFSPAYRRVGFNNSESWRRI